MGTPDHDAPSAEQFPAYSANYRFEGLRTLAASTRISMVLCLDSALQPIAIPPELVALGLPESENVKLEDRFLAGIDSRDHRVVASQIRVARSRGIGGALVRLREDRKDAGAEVAIQIFDLTDEHDAIVFIIGHFQPRWGGEVVASTAQVSAKIQHHKTNELGQYTELDDRLSDSVGWDPAEILGRTGASMLHELDRERAIQAWLQAVGGQDGTRQRCRQLTKSGEYKWIEFTYYNHLDDPGGGYMRIETLDVDSEMRALARARVGVSQFETLAKALPVGVVQMDLKGELVFANSWVREMTQVDGPEVTSNQLLAAVNVEDVPRLRDALKRCLRLEEVDFRIRLKNFKSGEYRLCLVRCRPLIMDGEIFGMIASLEDITESTSIQNQLRNQAMTDDLTGLPNRAALIERLQEMIESPDRTTPEFACLFLDLDGFKLVNDGLGHEAGDLLLVTIGQRLKSVLRPGDIVARVGGDEFVALCAWGSTASDVVKLAERLMAKVQEPVNVGSSHASVGVSVGIALHDGRDTKADVIIGNADMAMYDAKRAGGTRWAIYNDEMRQSMNQRFDLQSSMHDAIQNNEFQMHLQPLFNLQSNEVVAAEALIRWYHPTRGEISPGYFIPYIAESDLMIPLGWWIINDCCRIASEIIAGGAKNFRIGINITGTQLSEPGFADKVLATIARHGIDPFVVVLEVTETVWIDIGDQILATMQGLVDAGVELALDDFGTGYSSLNHVRDMPVQYLKIDYSYTSKLETCGVTRSIVEAIRDLAGKLGLEIIVEGVETDEQLKIVKGMGMVNGQGYLMGRPCDEQTFVEQYAPRMKRERSEKVGTA